LRVLGAAARNQKLAPLAGLLFPFAWTGLGLVIASGFIMFAGQARRLSHGGFPHQDGNGVAGARIWRDRAAEITGLGPCPDCAHCREMAGVRFASPVDRSDSSRDLRSPRLYQHLAVPAHAHLARGHLRPVAKHRLVVWLVTAQ